MAADGFSCPTGLDGSAAVRWIEVLLRECAYSTRDTASVCLGYTSIAAWLLAQLPQLWHNWRAGSSESLSLLFVFNWLAGDVTNLLGCILTHQLPFQTYLAAYFVFIDAWLSISMFSCALAGNSAYALSIVAKSTEPEFLLGSLPYLLGSAGTIVFDLVILGQYFRYPKQ